MELEKLETKLKSTKRHWAEAGQTGPLAMAYWAARPIVTGRWPLGCEIGPGQAAGPAQDLAAWDGHVQQLRWWLRMACSGTGKMTQHREKGRETGEPHQRLA
jgi:hypothetical protein